ncbi:MAG: RHS repeat domain-containing protein [Syntrophobacteraceae bacterium]
MRARTPGICLVALAVALGAAGAFRAPGALGAQYTYDELNRVTKVQYEDGAIVQYSYDAVGNRLTKSATRPNHPPDAPSSPRPSDGARAVSPRTTLSWTAADPDEGDSLTGPREWDSTRCAGVSGCRKTPS